MEARGNEEEAGVQTAIATVSLSGTLNEKLEAIAKAQFRGVEMFENDLLSFNGTPAEIRRMIEDLGLRTITFQPFRDFEGMPEPQRAKVFARAERKFDVMQELGCDLLLVCSNVSPEAIGGIVIARASTIPAQAPRPSNTRPRINKSKLGAAPHSTVPNRNIARPAIRAGRRPKRSDNGP